MVVDTTFFGSRDYESWSIVAFRDPQGKENLYWQVEKNETKSAYSKGRIYLESLGYKILSVTGDGFIGIKQAFEGISYQMCQVHMKRLIISKITRNPQTKAGQVLLALIKTLHKTNKKTFEKRFKQYTFMYFSFISEKTTNPFTGETYWTHRKLREAYFSLYRHLPYLFIFEKDNRIWKNTNSIEGHFSHLKDKLRVHRGLSKNLKVKIIFIILLASSSAPTEEKIKEIL